MKITLLGTGSPTPMRNRASSGYLVDVGDEMIVFDHGAGAHENFLRLGKSAAFMEAECFTPEGKLVAKATATAIPMPFKRLG